MRTKNSKFKYLWRANFSKRIITQDKDDKYSKHNPDAEWNPSSFMDFQEYYDKHKSELINFKLIGDKEVFTIDLSRPWNPIIYSDIEGKWGSQKHTLIHKEKRPLKDIRIIYYRKMQAVVKNNVVCDPEVLGYAIGYQGTDANGNNRQKIITVI